VSTIAERVAAGARFLDEHDPQWWRPDVERAIDLAKLDIEDPSVCVLGQRCPLESCWIYGSPYAGMAVQLTGDKSIGDEGKELWTWAVEFGFALDIEYPEDLTDEWRRVITERRSAS
jgi:hypothetical protein